MQRFLFLLFSFPKTYLFLLWCGHKSYLLVYLQDIVSAAGSNTSIPIGFWRQGPGTEYLISELVAPWNIGYPKKIDILLYP